MPLLREPSFWIAAALALIVGAAALLAVGRRSSRPVPGERRPDPAPWREDLGRRDPGREDLGREDPGREDRRREDAARDQLLTLLVRDPDTAVRAVADLAAGAEPAPVAIRLLRSGVAPVVVARVCGVPERGLADLIAGDLGLLEADGVPEWGPDQARAPGRTGRNRTVEPGATWARAGSPAGSTTATTG